jgi:hypothetical protein
MPVKIIRLYFVILGRFLVILNSIQDLRLRIESAMTKRVKHNLSLVKLNLIQHLTKYFRTNLPNEDFVY